MNDEYEDMMQLQTDYQRLWVEAQDRFYDEFEELYNKVGIDVFDIDVDLEIGIQLLSDFLERKNCPKIFAERKHILDYFKRRIKNGDIKKEYIIFEDKTGNLGLTSKEMFDKNKYYEMVNHIHTFKANSWIEAKAYKNGYEEGREQLSTEKERKGK